MTLLEIVLRNEVLKGVLKHRVDGVLLHFGLLLGVDVADVAGVDGLDQVELDIGVGEEGVRNKQTNEQTNQKNTKPQNKQINKPTLT